MYTTTIVNPKTGRTAQAKAWAVDPRAVIQAVKERKIQSARDLSWMLLNDDRSIQAMEAELYGDCAESNFALSIFENALDIMLGARVLDLLQTCVRQRVMPKPFSVCATRGGEVFIVLSSGRVL